MGFDKVSTDEYPARQWALVGYPGDGKSTFAARMKGDVLVIDADHRITEVVRQHNLDNVLRLSKTATDNADPRRIAALLKENMPGSQVGTVVIDSLTAIIAPLVSSAMLANAAGDNKNKVAAFSDKAMTLRMIQDSVTSWGVDTLWIYHLRDTRDAKANAITATSISTVELARLRRSLNMQLTVIKQGDRRGVRVDWARAGRQGMTLWDDSGSWLGMPEKIEESCYGGLSAADRAAIASALPTGFSGPDEAIAWGWEQGCFKDAQHSKNTYLKLKDEHKPASAGDMWELWLDAVVKRKSEQSVTVTI
jgi:hypothetical protein